MGYNYLVYHDGEVNRALELDYPIFQFSSHDTFNVKDFAARKAEKQEKPMQVFVNRINYSWTIKLINSV